MMGRTRWMIMLLALAVLLALTAPGLMAATADPIRDLAEAVAYWQEAALAAAVERDRAREELTRVTAERDGLLEGRATLEEIVGRLQDERNRAMENARAEAALRQMAERDLDIAIGTIKSLQEALQRLAGPRFGVILGATYDFRSRDPALLAGLQLTFR